jgi:hypothetical protein
MFTPYTALAYILQNDMLYQLYAYITLITLFT